MICLQCNENYIGKTRRKLSSRVDVHKQQIRYSALWNVPCSAAEKFKIALFYKINDKNVQLRKAKGEYLLEF